MSLLAKSVGDKIREQRLKCGYSQDALAFTCNIDRSYLGRIERGEVNITLEKLYLIAIELACEPSALLPSIAELESN